jgi:putative transcriptional regulator
MNFLAFHNEVCYNGPIILQPCSFEEEVQKMAVSYKKLFKLLIDRDMKKKEFRDYVGISYSTMSKLEKGENTTVEVLEKICLKLGCGINDIMEILPDSPDNGTGKGVE